VLVFHKKSCGTGVGRVHSPKGFIHNIEREDLEVG